MIIYDVDITDPTHFNRGIQILKFVGAKYLISKFFLTLQESFLVNYLHLIYNEFTSATFYVVRYNSANI